MSLTHSQSGALKPKAVQGMCLTVPPVCRIDVIGPKSSSAKLMNRLIGCFRS